MSICPNPNNKAVQDLKTYYTDEAVNEIFMKLQTPAFVRWFGNYKEDDPNMQTDEQAEEYVKNNLITILDMDDEFNIYNILNKPLPIDNFVELSDNNGRKSSVTELKNKIKIKALKEELINRSRDLKNVDNRYQYKGAAILHRVTDFTSKFFNSLFKNPEKEKEGKVKIFALKGTILHAFNKAIIDKLLRKELINYTNINKEIYDELKDEEDFKAFKNDSSFFSLKKSEITQLTQYFTTLIAEIRKEDPDAEFLTELTIVDPQKSIAGTVDLLVLKSDGKIYIYDWKSILPHSFLNFNEDELSLANFKQYKKEAYSIQLNLYRDILKNSYNVDLNNIQRERIVPIVFDLFYRKGEVDTTRGYSMFNIGEVEEQPSFNEITKYETLNKALELLFLKRRQIVKDLKNKFDDPKLASDLDIVERNIKDIQLYYDIKGILTSVKILTNRFNILQKSYEINNKKFNSEEDLNDFVDINKELTFYEQILANLITYTNERINETTDKEKEGFENYLLQLKILSQNILTNQSYASQVFKDFIKTSLDEKGSSIDIENISEGGLMDIAKQKSDIKNPVLQAFFTLFIKEVENEKYIKLQKFKDDIIKYKAILNSYAKKNNKTLGDVMNMFLNSKKDLVGIFSPKFREDFKKYKKNLSSRDEDEFMEAFDWIIENSEFNREEYEIFKEKSFKVIENTNEDPEAILLAKEDFEKRYDVDKHNEAYNKNNSFLRGKKTSSSYSVEFAKIASDPLLLEVYEGLSEFNVYARKITGKKINNNFAPNITNDLASALVENRGSILNIPSNLADALKNSFSTTVDEDAFLGMINYDGERTYNIPVYYTSLFLTELTKKQQEDIEREVAEMVDGKGELLKKGTIEFQNEVIRKSFKLRNDIAINNKSSDFLTNFISFAETVYSYEALTNRLDTLYALKNYAENKAEFSPTSITNKALFDRAMGKFTKLTGMPKNDYELLETIENEYVYGQKIQSKDQTLQLKDGRVLSANKSVLSLMNSFSLNALGFKPILGIINSMGVRVNFNTIVREGVYMNKKVVEQSLNEVVKDKNKFFAFAEFMGTDPKGMLASAKLSTKKLALSKVLNSNTAYAFLSKPEELQANQGLVAMSLFYRVVNGAIVNPNKLFREGDTIETWNKRVEQFPTVYESVTKEEEVLADGTKRINIKTDLSKEELANFRIAVQKVTTGFTGNVSEYDKAAGNTNMFFRVFMQMKNWIVPLLKQRTSETRIDIATNQIDVGRYAILFAEFSKQNAEKMASLKSFTKEIFFLNNANNSLVNKKTAEFYYKEWLEREFINDIEKGKRLVPFEQFVKLRNDKFRANAYEVRIVLILLLLIAGLSSDLDDDGEELYKEIYGGKTAFKILNRAYNEVTFFTNPNSFKTIVKGAVPVTVFTEKAYLLLTNTADEIRDKISIVTTGKDRKGINTKDPNDMTPSLYYSMWFLGGLSNLLTEFDIPQNYSEFIGTQLEKKNKKNK